MRAQLRPPSSWRAPYEMLHFYLLCGLHVLWDIPQPRAPETGVPLVAFTLKPEKLEHGYTEFDVADRLRQSGWSSRCAWFAHPYPNLDPYPSTSVPPKCRAGALMALACTTRRSSMLTHSLPNVIASPAGSSQRSRVYTCIRL